jgi:hypothetical protein
MQQREHYAPGQATIDDLIDLRRPLPHCVPTEALTHRLIRAEKHLMGRNASRVIQNEAGKKFERSAFLQTLEPSPAEGGPDTADAMAATACELADRVRKKNWHSVLSGVLFPNAPRSSTNSSVR